MRERKDQRERERERARCDFGESFSRMGYFGVTARAGPPLGVPAVCARATSKRERERERAGHFRRGPCISWPHNVWRSRARDTTTREATESPHARAESRSLSVALKSSEPSVSGPPRNDARRLTAKSENSLSLSLSLSLSKREYDGSCSLSLSLSHCSSVLCDLWCGLTRSGKALTRDRGRASADPRDGTCSPNDSIDVRCVLCSYLPRIRFQHILLGLCRRVQKTMDLCPTGTFLREDAKIGDWSRFAPDTPVSTTVSKTNAGWVLQTAVFREQDQVGAGRVEKLLVVTYIWAESKRYIYIYGGEDKTRCAIRREETPHL